VVDYGIMSVGPSIATRPGPRDPSPVTLRLVKAPERGTLFPRERAVFFG
jgi:hypothetical protein